jgi:predicted ATPase
MKIQSFAYKNNFQGWGFDKIDFFDLTLLVGVSGVGKTQILHAIQDLKDIAMGKAIYGIEWDIFLTTKNGDNYRWQGQFEKISLENENKFSLVETLFSNEFIKPNIKTEYIYINHNKKPTFERKNKQIIFNDNKMPKLSLNESCVHLFREEEIINPLYEGFKQIVSRDHTQRESSGTIINSESENIYKDLDSIKESELEAADKLKAVYQAVPKVFKQIKSNFIDVFPQIEDLKLEIVKLKGFQFAQSYFFFKEKNVPIWIPLHRMSAGMLRTLLHISELFLCQDGSIILIDDFENSLGVNCIDVLTEDLVFENKRIQFIVTSHHPYIINKIPYEYWKIVTRRGGKIVTYDAKTFDLGDSRQERFMNLINLPQYRQGLADVE